MLLGASKELEVATLPQCYVGSNHAAFNNTGINASVCPHLW